MEPEAGRYPLPLAVRGVRAYRPRLLDIHMTAFARKKAEEQRLVDRELGKISLTTRLKRMVNGHSNFSKMGKRAAEHKERVKLAKLLKERKEDGTRERNRKRGTSSSKSGVNQK